MRSQRLMSCLQLLQGERRLTARYLAEQLAVSMRTIYRDVEALCEAGVPIHMERGPAGGIVLADTYRRALAAFTNEELHSLFAAGSEPMTDLGIASRREALRKLAGALPAGQRETATAIRERLLVDHNRWGRGEQPTAILGRIRGALERQRRVRLVYRDRTGSVTERLVDPLGLVAKAGIWYLIAHEASKGYRSFRAERIAAADVSAQTFVRPAGFNLEAYWNSSVATIERGPESGYDVILRVRPDAAPSLAMFWKSEPVAQDAEAVTVRVTFSSPEAAVRGVVMFEGVIAIVSPPDLAAAVVAHAEAVACKFRAREVDPIR